MIQQSLNFSGVRDSGKTCDVAVMLTDYQWSLILDALTAYEVKTRNIGLQGVANDVGAILASLKLSRNIARG